MIYLLIQTFLLVCTAFAAGYLLIFAVAGHFYREAPDTKSVRLRKIAVLIPAYKEDEVIVEAARAALRQQYPARLFDVVVIADSFRKETLELLREIPVRLMEVSFKKSTKSKALNYALSALPCDYEIAVVLDADNIMDNGFLSRINAAFDRGFTAVQGHRVAKNLNTSWAVLDAVSEEINNHIFRKGHRALGLSSAIIGSGMAFDYSFFRNLMSGVNAVGGFDKEIELKMLKAGIKIAYVDNACVYDEKIQRPADFKNQRRRWLSAQLYYFRKGIADALACFITRGNVDYLDKAVQFIMPPRVLLLGAGVLLGLCFSALNYVSGTGNTLTIAWVTVNLVIFVSILLAVPRKYFNTGTLAAARELPRGMMLMLLSLLKIKGANRTFIHTRHTIASGGKGQTR